MKKSNLIVALLIALAPTVALAQSITLDAASLVPRASVSFSPRSGSFVEGSTFEVPVLINTNGNNINALDIKINFDPVRMTIVNPSSGKSIIGVWVSPPTYDNAHGTVNFTGVIPDGITTAAGLVATITFKAQSLGPAKLNIQSTSHVLLNDGLGTEMRLDLGRADYDILPKAPDGVVVRSETHPIQDNWYNNNSPAFSWDQDPGVSGFSYALDDNPSTVPPSTVMTPDTVKAYQNLKDGLWYFHVKAIKNGVWGTTGHYLVRIDTAPPAKFTPQVQYLVAAAALIDRALVSFFTTDNLSGVDHYEVGVIDKTQPTTVSPVFVQTESPYQIPKGGNLRVIVRAIDHAGNVRDESIDVGSVSPIGDFVSHYLIYLLFGILVLIILGGVIHYLYGHHIVRNLTRAWAIVAREEKEEKNEKEPPPPVAPPPPTPPTPRAPPQPEPPVSPS